MPTPRLSARTRSGLLLATAVVVLTALAVVDPAGVELISAALRSHQGVVSSQVLSEYANVALTKLGQPPRVVRRQLEILSTLRVVSLTPELIIRAIEIKDLYGLSFWDASIIAAAESARCERILSEDMNAGQVYCGVKMTNPLTEGQ